MLSLLFLSMNTALNGADNKGYPKGTFNTPKVRPDLVKLHHCGKILKIFGHFGTVYLVLDKILN